MTHKNRKKLRNSRFEVLDVLFLGLKASSKAWMSFMGAISKLQFLINKNIECLFQPKKKFTIFFMKTWFRI